MEEARTLAEKILPWSEIIRTLIITTTIAVVGFSIQRSIAQQSLRATYTELAISILSRDTKTEADQKLRDYAVDVLRENSNTPIEPEVLELIRTGNLNLPPSVQKELEDLRKFEYGIKMSAAEESFQETERRREINETWLINTDFSGSTRKEMERNSQFGQALGQYSFSYAYQSSSEPRDTVIGQYPTPEESPRIEPGASILLLLSDGTEGAE